MIYREKDQSWTIPQIINFAAQHAKGIYLMFLGVDHMLSPELVEYFSKSNAGYAVFLRKYALIDQWGNLLKIQYRQGDEFEDCICDYTSLGWVRRNHFIKLGGLNESLSGPKKHSADVNFFRGWCALRGTTREHMIARGRQYNPFYYMLPEKRSTRALKGRNGHHWNLLSYLRPVNYLHHLPDRDKGVKEGCQIPLDITPDEADRIRFVHVGGWQDGKVSGRKFKDFVAWRHPAEVQWMLGENR